jgi:arginine decarboxylase
MKLVEKYGTARFTLSQFPIISIRPKVGLGKSMEKTNTRAAILLLYQSSHFEFIMNEAFKNNIHVETSSAFDNIVENHGKNGKINKKSTLCYLQWIQERSIH